MLHPKGSLVKIPQRPSVAIGVKSQLMQRNILRLAMRVPIRAAARRARLIVFLARCLRAVDQGVDARDGLRVAVVVVVVTVVGVDTGHRRRA